jgi:hypothetical protein
MASTGYYWPPPQPLIVSRIGPHRSVRYTTLRYPAICYATLQYTFREISSRAAQ